MQLVDVDIHGCRVTVTTSASDRHSLPSGCRSPRARGAEVNGRARFGVRRRSSPVTTAHNAAPEQPRLEPDSRALSAVSIVRRCARKERISTDRGPRRRLIGVGESSVDRDELSATGVPL
jgi:hypothetical protein